MFFSLFVLVLFVLSIIHKNYIYDISLDSINHFFRILFPTLFISLMIVDLVNISTLPHKISNVIHPFFKKIFKFNSPTSTYIYMMSFIVPLPTSGKLVNDAYLNEHISLNEANHILKFNGSISLVSLIAVGTILFNCFITKIFFVLSFYLSSIIIGIVTSIFHKDKEQRLISTPQPQINKLDFFSKSITKNINILLWVLGFNIFFNVIVNLILIYIPISFYNLPIFHLFFDRSLGMDLMLDSLFHQHFVAGVLLFFIPFLSIYNFIELKLIFNKVDIFSFIFYRFLTGILTLLLFTLFIIVL